MPRFSNRASRYSSAPTYANISPAIRQSGKNYVSEQSASRRHEFTSKIPELTAIQLGDYAEVKLCEFGRSFGAGADDPPTATQEVKAIVPSK